MRNTLASLPPNAVMFGTTDEFDVTMRYLQLAVGLRPDVVFVRPGAMWDPRYAARFARDGLVFDPAKDSSVTLAGRVLESGRPLFVTPWEKDVIKAYPSYRFGVLMRVLPPTAAAPSLDDIIALDRAVFEKFEARLSDARTRRRGRDDRARPLRRRLEAHRGRAHRRRASRRGGECLRGLAPARAEGVTLSCGRGGGSPARIDRSA